MKKNNSIKKLNVNWQKIKNITEVTKGIAIIASFCLVGSIMAVDLNDSENKSVSNPNKIVKVYETTAPTTYKTVDEQSIYEAPNGEFWSSKDDYEEYAQMQREKKKIEKKENKIIKSGKYKSNDGSCYASQKEMEMHNLILKYYPYKDVRLTNEQSEDLENNMYEQTGVFAANDGTYFTTSYDAELWNLEIKFSSDMNKNIELDEETKERIKSQNKIKEKLYYITPTDESLSSKEVYMNYEKQSKKIETLKNEANDLNSFKMK